MRREWEPEDLIACWTLVEGVLAEEGVTDFSAYGYGGSDAELQVDIYVDELSPVAP